MRYSQCIFTAALAIIPLTAGAQDAHRRNISSAHSDQKGQTCVTVDYGDSARIWNLSDGALQVKLSLKSPEWNTKLLRYKINHPDYVSSGEKWDWPDDEAKNGVTPTILSINGERVAKLTTAPEYYAFNRSSGKLVSYEFPNDKTNIYRHTIPPESASDKATTAKLLATVAGTGNVFFSPKGTWLYQPTQFRIINPESGAAITLSGLDPKNNAGGSYSFSPDETQLALALRDGMTVFDVASGKVLRNVRLPKKLSGDGLVIYPQSDMLSFLYTGSLFTKTMKAYLVKDGSTIQLHD